MSDELDGIEEVDNTQENETAQSIVDYNKKIETLEAQLASYHADRITNIKRQAMKDNRYTDSQIERYLTHIQGKTLDEINASVLKLVDEIPAQSNNGVDPSPFNGAKQTPSSNVGNQLYEHGRSVARRLKKEGKFR